jgi:hypothetical protein
MAGAAVRQMQAKGLLRGLDFKVKTDGVSSYGTLFFLGKQHYAVLFHSRVVILQQLLIPARQPKSV